MKNRNLGLVALLMLASLGLGSVAATGQPDGTWLRDFWRNDVIPLWRHGPNPKLPDPDMLEDIKPETLPAASKGR